MGALNLRRVEIVDKCPLCGIDGETVDHLILRCPFTEVVWSLTGKGGGRDSFVNFVSWFQARTQVDSLGDLQVVCWTIWSIWKVRNDVVWNQSAPLPSSASRLAMDMYKAWCDRFQAGQTEELTHTGTTDIVQQSPRNIYCWFDAALFPQEGTAGFGCYILLADGSFGTAFNGPIQSTQDPAMAEIMACKEVLSWLKNNGFREVLLFSDCLNLVTSLQEGNEASYRSYFGASVDDCLSLMAFFDVITLSFVRRECNSKAHSLARRAGTQFREWDSPHSFA
ncbi:unnamed protein product [Cuscuta campestris]|uniref:RNase H type-1 domain-containing protein n=1 Tax=Cuscuta campestris TaxID=132261 RepID=A0A484ND00_9ASTE|nr:unnamed protein product [Cuscuta campestris]